MQQEKMKVLLYLKKSSLDKSGQAPIMGRITHNRSMAQFSTKLSCRPELWNTRESRLNGKSREAVVTNAKLEQLLISIQSINGFASVARALPQRTSRRRCKARCCAEPAFCNATTKCWRT